MKRYDLGTTNELDDDYEGDDCYTVYNALENDDWDFLHEVAAQGDEDARDIIEAQEVQEAMNDLLEYWIAPYAGATGDDAISDSHSDSTREKAIKLICAGGPWDDEILGPIPEMMPISWEPMDYADAIERAFPEE